ncbi:MAG: DUF5610 domain-containing protein [Nitrospinae bacterium]|nr:DUF5610 domain-containing protein [Nitrospinota bacterium]
MSVDTGVVRPWSGATPVGWDQPLSFQSSKGLPVPQSGADSVSFGQGAPATFGGQGEQGMFAQVTYERYSKELLNATFKGSDGQEFSVSAEYSEYFRASMSYQSTQAQAPESVEPPVESVNPFGPEATAGRITDFALSFFPMFAKEHGDMSYEEQLRAFRDLVEGAIDEGFQQAMDILGELPDEVNAQIQETRSLITQKLDAFFSHAADKGAAGAQEALQSGDWTTFVKDFFANADAAQTQEAAA